MSEYVERAALMGKLTAADMLQKLRQMSGEEVYSVLLWLVNDAPAADVAPVVHGCFEPCFDENGNWRQGFAKCSNCGKEYYAQVINHFGYCPNCGAKMDGGADNA